MVDRVLCGCVDTMKGKTMLRSIFLSLGRVAGIENDADATVVGAFFAFLIVDTLTFIALRVSETLGVF